MSELETKPLVSLCFGVHVGNGGVDENPTIKINLLIERIIVFKRNITNVNMKKCHVKEISSFSN